MARIVQPLSLHLIVSVITVLLLLLLLPALYFGLTNIVSSVIIDNYVDNIRLTAQEQASTLQTTTAKTGNKKIQETLDNFMLDANVVYSSLIIDNKVYTSNLQTSEDVYKFTEDLDFGQHGDMTYYIRAPILLQDKTVFLHTGFDESNIHIQLKKTNHHILLILSLFFIIITAMTLLFSIRLTKSLKRLKNISQRIANGDTKEKLILYTHIREFNDLSSNLELMRKELIERNAKLEKKALYDALTGIPNRLLFSEVLHNAIEKNNRYGKSYGLIIIDVDKFKEVNDNFGHPAGDKLIKHIANQLQDVSRDADIVARIGGDEFAVILSEVDKNGIIAYCDKIYHSVSKKILLNDHIISAKISIGATLFERGNYSSEDYIQQADAAMYAAKASNHHLICFNRENFEASMRRSEINRTLQSLSKNDNMGLYILYQPKFDLRTGNISGVEALARWNHSSLGLISPDDFIEVAEQQGYIHKITDYVLTTVIKQACLWHKNASPLHVSVNISPIDLLDNDFPKRLFTLITKYRLPPSLLELEITENIIIQDSQVTRKILNRIRNHGIGIAIDDFGTGYSGFQNLRALPFNTIKIDKGFIQDMLSNEEDQIIVNGAIEIAHKLGMNVVAEGVENPEVAYALTQQGCDMAQGFLYSKAVKAEVINQKYLHHYTTETL